MSEVAEDLKAIFKVRRGKTARALAEEFVRLHGKRFPKAVSVFEAGIEDALTYLRYPGSHHARLRTTNMLERLFREVKRRTRVVGVFPNEVSASTLATEIALRSSEQWALKRYLTMDALEAMEKPNWTCIGSVDCLRLRTVRGKEKIATNEPDLPAGVSPRSYPAGQDLRPGASHPRDRSRDRCLRWHP